MSTIRPRLFQCLRCAALCSMPLFLLFAGMRSQTVPVNEKSATAKVASIPSYELSPADVASEQDYLQDLRPQFHYTALQGHLGDATGLIFYRGEYHLFYIFDKWARKSSVHKRWGHAISTDLIHWSQMPALLDTRVDHAPGSGSGVVDWNNSSGFRTGVEKTLVVFYTDYKKGSSIIYSNDRGRSWVRYKGNPVLPGVEDIRDPNVFWYDPGKEWRMIRYEKRGFAFYASSDLLHWRWLSRIDGFYECPDLFELRVTNAASERRWVLIDGDGSYVIGNFDGTTFVPESAKLRSEYGSALYATQTWKHPFGDSSPIQIAWLKYPPQSNLSWDGQMSFPVSLSLRQMHDGIRLIRKPIRAIDDLRTNQQIWKDLTIGPKEQEIPSLRAELLDLRVVMKPKDATEFGLEVHGHEIRYSMVDHLLHVGSASAPLQLETGKLRLQILIDRSSIEVFADLGEVSISVITLTPSDAPVTFFSQGGKTTVTSLEANTLESIWLDTR